MKPELEEKFKVIDAMIKAAQWEKAQNELTKLKRKPIVREDLLPFAALCRRANVPSLGVTSLRPIVRPSSRKVVSEARPEEVVEYTACLTKLGALREAKKLLSEVCVEKYPQAIRVAAALHVKTWEYPEAIPLFEKYLETGLTPYQRQIEKLNLCMCYVFQDRLGEAESLLQEILKEKEILQHPLIHSNALRLLGNVHYQHHDYGLAIKYFEEAFDTIPDKSGMDRFLLRKWIAITNYIVENGDEASVRLIQNIRKEALEWKHWESIRDIDYQIACHHRDEKKLIHLYFGTPYQTFRDRIKKRFSSLRFPESYQWILETSKDKTQLMDWSNGELKPGQANHRLLTALSTDFYRPFGTLDLFECIYPDEYYSFGDSEQRVYQVITRTRKWLSEKSYPLTIESEENLSRFVPEGPCGILVRVDSGVVNREMHALKEIREKLGNEFTAKQAAEALGTSKRNILFILSKAVEEGTLSRTGSGTKFTYRFVDEKEKQAA